MKKFLFVLIVLSFTLQTIAPSFAEEEGRPPDALQAQPAQQQNQYILENLLCSTLNTPQRTCTFIALTAADVESAISLLLAVEGAEIITVLEKQGSRTIRCLCLPVQQAPNNQ